MFTSNRKIILSYIFKMMESKSFTFRIYRLIASNAWMTESEAKVI